jgi:hypothetical protein
MSIGVTPEKDSHCSHLASREKIPFGACALKLAALFDRVSLSWINFLPLRKVRWTCHATVSRSILPPTSPSAVNHRPCLRSLEVVDARPSRSPVCARRR